MPGLFGYFLKSKKVDHTFLLEKMCEKLLHFDFYAKDTIETPIGGIAKIDVGLKYHRKIYIDPETKNIIGLYGDVYSAIKPDDSDFSNIDQQNPEPIISSIYNTCGEETAQKLNGDFLLAIYDTSEECLLIANDRFGFRHLYIYEDNNTILFSPEIKAFLAYPNFDKALDENGISDYFNYFYHLGEKTNFQNVKLMPPATVMVMEKKTRRHRSYWRPKYTQNLGLDRLNEAIEAGYKLFTKSVENRLFAGRKVIIPLSGGLDSRLIVSAAQKLDCDITTATFGRRGVYEHRIAQKVCRELRLPPPVLVTIKNDWIHRFGEQLSWLSEANQANLNLTTQYGFKEVMGIEYDCFLNGIFGGHLTFGSPYFSKNAFRGEPTPTQRTKRLINGLDGHLFESQMYACATPKLHRIANTYRHMTIEEEWARTSESSDVFAFRWDAFFIYNRIRRGMNTIDQNRFFYNDQLPFASYELYDLYLSLAPELMLNHHLYKAIYRTHLPKLARVPWTGSGVNLYNTPGRWTKLKRTVNHELTWYIPRLTRGKLNFYNKYGFASYNDAIYRSCISLRKWVKEILLSEQCLDRGYFSREGMRELLRKQDRGVSAFTTISKIVLFELWARKFLD